ncbi:MAG: biotin transporter BioY [Phycisphaerae bacterium]
MSFDSASAPQSAASLQLVTTPAASRIRRAAAIVAASLLVAVCAQIHVPVGPVPVTLQTYAVLLVGAWLGARGGALAMALYLAEGAAGLPVFAALNAGPAALIGPTAGYLWSFPLAAGLMGWLMERNLRRSAGRTVAAILISSSLILLCGWTRLASLLGPAAAWRTGVVPFLPGDAAKLALLIATLRLRNTGRRAPRGQHDALHRA